MIKQQAGSRRLTFDISFPVQHKLGCLCTFSMARLRRVRSSSLLGHRENNLKILLQTKRIHIPVITCVCMCACVQVCMCMCVWHVCALCMCVYLYVCKSGSWHCVSFLILLHFICLLFLLGDEIFHQTRLLRDVSKYFLVSPLLLDICQISLLLLTCHHFYESSLAPMGKLLNNSLWYLGSINA